MMRLMRNLSFGALLVTLLVVARSEVRAQPSHDYYTGHCGGWYENGGLGGCFTESMEWLEDGWDICAHDCGCYCGFMSLLAEGPNGDDPWNYCEVVLEGGCDPLELE